MSGKRLLARTGMVAALGMLIFLVLSTVDSQATPIKPDVQKLIKQSQQSHQPFIPARAGWNEPVATANAARNPVLDSVIGDHMRDEYRATLMEVATPDPWIALALATLILLLRTLRGIETKRTRLRAVPVLVPERAVPQARLAA
jgi:hypothetical protein